MCHTAHHTIPTLAIEPVPNPVADASKAASAPKSNVPSFYDSSDGEDDNAVLAAAANPAPVQQKPKPPSECV